MLKFKFVVNGEELRESELNRLEYERNLHMLHQMKRVGIEIKDGDKVLSDEDIDWLTMDEANKVSKNIRMSYDGETIVSLYQNSFKKAEEYWKSIPFAQDKPMVVSRCYMEVEGITLDTYMKYMKKTEINLPAHPEHFMGVEKADRLYGAEPFGMFGTHTLCEVKFADFNELGAQIQADKDPEYPLGVAGRAFLLDGTTELNSPYHQFKPMENGFKAKLAVYWPEGTYKEIVDGHCLHLAMEFYRGLKLIDEMKDNNQESEIHTH